MVVAADVAIVVVESIFSLETQPCSSSRVLPFSHHRREREREREIERESFIAEMVCFLVLKKDRPDPISNHPTRPETRTFWVGSGFSLINLIVIGSGCG